MLGKKLHIKSSSRKSSWETFKEHSRKAMRKTFNSFICLLVLMLISFVASSYQLKPVDYGPAAPVQNGSQEHHHKHHHKHHDHDNGITNMMSRKANEVLE